VANPSLTVCVLGGSGFVGSEIVSALAARGYVVRVPTRVAARADHLRVLPTAEIRVADVHDPRHLNRLFAGADTVVNLVGILNERGRSGAGFRRAHGELAAKVIEAAQAQRVRRVLHMSALGAAADAPSHYLRTKFEAEGRVRAAPSSIGWTIFRPSVIFGPHDSLTNRFAKLLRAAGGMLPLARPAARFAPVYVVDVAEAYLRALDDRATLGQIYELCGPDVVTLEELVRQVARTAEIDARLIRLPDFVARLQGLVFDFVPGKPFSTDNYHSLTIDSLCRDNGCARLGIRPASLAGLVGTWLGPVMRGTYTRMPVRPR
jgi:NADH dehydrogenase